MVFVANPDGADVVLNQCDRLGALVPAAAQTRSCSLCGFVDTDAFVNDLTMCEACGTLLPAGPMACRRCDAGPENIVVRLYAGCAECKGRVHSVRANSEPVDPEVQGHEAPELRKSEPGSSGLLASTEARKQAAGAVRDQMRSQP